MTNILLPRLTRSLRRRVDDESLALVAQAARALQPVLARAAAARPGRLTSIGVKGAGAVARLAVEPAGRLARFDTGREMGIVFVDIADFTAFTAQRGDGAAVELLARTEAVVAGAVGLGRGEIVKRLGDGFLLAFPSPSQGVRAATILMERMRRAIDLDPGSPISLRISVHAGRPRVSGDDLLGHDVNVAAHLLDHCAPGEVVVSGAAQRAAERRLKRAVFDRPRRVPLRGAPEQIEIFSARLAASATVDGPPPRV